MKVVKLFAPLLALLLLNSTLSINLLLKSPQNDYKKLTNFVCKITKDITKSTSDTQDVLIGNLGGQVWSSTVNGIAGCVGDENGVIVTDFNKPLTEESLRKASVVILAFGSIYQHTIEELIVHNQHASVWSHMSKFICIVDSSTSNKLFTFILKTLDFFGFINVALVYKVGNSIQSATLESIHGNVKLFSEIHNGADIYFDKLKNLRRYVYRIAIYHQPPRVLVSKSGISSQMTNFILAIVEAQNAYAQYILLNDYRDFPKLWENRKMDLTLNTGMTYTDDSNIKLMTYDENGYCALIPLPPKTSLTELMLVKPFDGMTWLFFAITIAASVTVWRMFRSRGAVDSHWLLAYGFFVMFIGQGVDISRQNRMVLAILLQLIIFMVFVLNQAYEGVITSFMIQPIYENRLETFEQLLASEYKVITDEAFLYRFNETEDYKVLMPRLNLSSSYNQDQIKREILRKHYAFISKCDHAKVMINDQMSYGEKVSDYYYLMLEIFMPYLERLEASFLNPFIERLQYYMDLSFQAGLPQAWKLFMPENNIDQYITRPSGEVSLLRLEDLTQVFSTLIIGFITSTVVLLIEIFFHSCLKNLVLSDFGQMLRERVHQMAYNKRKQLKDQKYGNDEIFSIGNRNKKQKRRKKEKLKVRKILVLPRNSEMDEEV